MKNYRKTIVDDVVTPKKPLMCYRISFFCVPYPKFPPACSLKKNQKRIGALQKALKKDRIPL